MLRVTGCGLRVFLFRISDFGLEENWGLGIGGEFAVSMYHFGIDVQCSMLNDQFPIRSVALGH